MSAATAEASFGRRASWAVNDTLLLTWRNLIHYVRVPQLIAFAVIQPIMFTLLFAFVFGGAIQTPNGKYVDYLIPGIIVQTVVFGSMQSGINIAEDMQKGLMDRFRSLPIARGVVLAARTLSDTVRHTLSVFIMAGVGYAIGYRFHGGLADVGLALVVVVAMGLAFSWIAATIGLLVKDTQTAEIAGFTWVFPVVFCSSIFVTVESMRQQAEWLAWIAERNPITLAADATRAYSLDAPVGDAAWMSLVWCGGIIAVFATLAVWRFRRLA